MAFYKNPWLVSTVGWQKGEGDGGEQNKYMLPCCNDSTLVFNTFILLNVDRDATN